MSEDKKTILSGIQSSGEFTIGNYFGAIKNWVERQDDYNCMYFIADMHAITVNQVPATLRKRSFECAAMLLASGIDPEKSLLFIQSHVHQHAELGWILNCFTHMGELSRMTQYKDKSKNQGENIKVGLFDYPVLMAADILLYQADLVPVGDDQKQHLELTRTIANRFNNTFSPTFKVPEGYYGESGARIMSLQDPSKKMSKSDENKNGFISMIDKKDVIMAKCKRAVTDSDMNIIYDKENKPGVSNLLEIYSCATNKTIEEAVKDFEGKNYAYFKTAVGESIADRLTPIQDEFERLCKDKAYVNEVLQKSSEQASYIANKTLRKVKKKVGFYSL
ncbi:MULTISPECIES: tryptophan--tRNA ligase [unclassified Anaerofustis]|uniref:tryptophan--tRNA ligase n=1 Tax=Anaerofustis TaxID=264995 RepID=UPI00209C652D|nr:MULTISPECIES: tryptophan--tRNA ligase [unclassified Anaerofustis]MCO8193100.1 tryptophan--tRNA ligase [Anaerofustis sp. NSJ-163]